jgi:hypothetical protein
MTFISPCYIRLYTEKGGEKNVAGKKNAISKIPNR